MCHILCLIQNFQLAPANRDVIRYANSIVNVDKIIVLNQGTIIEQGNHKELLEKNGYYSSLYNSYYMGLN